MKPMRTLLVSFLIATAFVTVGAPHQVRADDVTLINPLSSGNCNSTNTDCLGAFLNSILEFIIRIGTVVIILMMVYVGYLFVVAQGNSSKIEEARRALLWTIVGALILLGAQAIAIGIQSTVQAISAGG